MNWAWYIASKQDILGKDSEEGGGRELSVPGVQ